MIKPKNNKLESDLKQINTDVQDVLFVFGIEEFKYLKKFGYWNDKYMKVQNYYTVNND